MTANLEAEDSLNTVADKLLGLNQSALNEEQAVNESVHSVDKDNTALAETADTEVATAAVKQGEAPPHLPPGPVTSKARALAGGQVNRIVEDGLPEGMHISRDARIALQKAASVTLLYLACLADESRKEAKLKRSTLTVQDIHAALELAGMGHLVPQMQVPVKRTRPN